MSYLVLARKYRPQTFPDVVGQRAVVRTLQNALQRNRVAHAMLFSGVRGVGKTTLARIMAKALNCKGLGSAPPCNQCASCVEITAGNALDLHEIDGASNRGIQEIRDLKENLRFFPVKSRYKIVIIDEVHMLTAEAFNALLKTLEEPPAHVYFMFATTELHKVPVTILSRCQRFELSRVPFAELVAFFRKISTAEGINISDLGLELIGREAEGSVRDGLSLLDQVFSFGGQEVTDADVTEVLGLVDRQIYETLTRALLAGDLAQALDTLERAYTAGLDLKRFTAELLAYGRAVLVCKTCKAPQALLDVPDQELRALMEIAAGQGVETLSQYFQVLLQGAEELQSSTNPRMVLEMTFVRAVQAGQVVPVTALIAKLDTLLGGAPLPLVRPESAAAGPAAPAPPLPRVVPTLPEKKTPEPRPLVTPPAEPSLSVGRDVSRDWDAFIEYVKERKRWMAHVLMLTSDRKEAGRELHLKFDEPAECTVLQEQENMKLLARFVQDFFQRELAVCLDIHVSGAAGGEDKVTDASHDERRALARDPRVQLAVEVLEGQVLDIRPCPRSR